MTPLDILVRILNNQLSSLMWIDEKVSYLLRHICSLSLIKLLVMLICILLICNLEEIKKELVAY